MPRRQTCDGRHPKTFTIADSRELAGSRAPATRSVEFLIENQIALGDEIPVQRTAQRLMDEGLDRHDTIHAIGSVLVGHMFDLTRQPATDDDPNQPYCRAGAS
jgi:hypothetical protein